MATDWDARLARWKDELDLFAVLDDAHWVPLAVRPRPKPACRGRRCGPGTATGRSRRA